MFYRRKLQIVEAFFWTAGPDQTEDPEWIVEAIKDGTVTIKKRKDTGEPYMIIDNPDFNNMVARVGDYIVHDEAGNIFSMKPREFTSLYELCR